MTTLCSAIRLAARCLVAGALAGLWLTPSAAGAQPGPSRVRYTEAREHDVRRRIELPGTVEARTSSLVASEVEGLVVRLAAREGEAVGKGQVLVQLRTDALELRREAAAAQLREAEARRNQAKQSLARSNELFESGILSRSELDDSRFELDAWTGRADQIGAEIARIELDLDRLAVRAPFAGVIVAERCEIGEWIGRGDPVAELLSLRELEVRVDVPERHFFKINPGQPVAVSFESIPGYSIDGRVGAIIPRASSQARTFPMKVRLRNEDGRIAAGMLARVSFAAGEPYRAMVVPKDAVLTRGELRFVYRIEGGTVVNVPVETGVRIGDWVEVRGESLHPGSKVVTRGNERLRPGQEVVGQLLEYTFP